MTIPHFAYPFRLQGNSFAVLDQDSDGDVVQGVQILLGTRINQRVELPGYGIDEPLFADGVDAQGIIDAVSDWEPRATVDVRDDVDNMDELMEHIQVTVSGGDTE